MNCHYATCHNILWINVKRTAIYSVRMICQDFVRYLLGSASPDTTTCCAYDILPDLGGSPRSHPELRPQLAARSLVATCPVRAGQLHVVTPGLLDSRAQYVIYLANDFSRGAHDQGTSGYSGTFGDE